MADIIIRGMVLPLNGEMAVIRPDGQVRLYIRGNEAFFEYPNHCGKAIKLPPHGRLIDADVLIANLNKDPLFPLVEQYGIVGVIKAQDTIISASGGEL